MRIYFLLFCLSPYSTIYSQDFNTDINATAYGMANAAVANSDEWSLFHNVGGIGNTKEITVLNSINRRFNLNQLSTFHLGILLPKKNSAFGISIQHFGDKLFNQQQYALAFGHRLGITSAGIKINLHRTNAMFIENKNLIYIELGAITRISPFLSIGFHVANLEPGIFAFENLTTIALILKTGISFHKEEHFKFNMEFEKNQNVLVRVKMGIWYRIFNALLLTTGVQLNPIKHYFGIGYHFKKISIDMAISHHRPLGFSQILSLKWQFNEDEN